MPAMKRPAAATAQHAKLAKLAKVVKESPTAPKVSSPVAPVVTPFTRNCEIVAEALRASEMGSTEMLINMLPFAAQPPPRHQFQEHALDFVGHELERELQLLKNKVVELQTKVAGVDKERSHRSAAIEAAVADVEAKTGVHVEAKIFLATQRSVLAEAKAAAGVARAAQKEGDAELDAAAQRESMITSAMEEKNALESASAEESNIEPRAEKLCKDCHLLIQDAGLLKAAAMSLGKVPDVRGVFDKMVLLQFSEEMAKHLVTAQQILAEGKPGMMARAAKVQECEAVELAANDAVMSAVVMESNVDVAKQEAEAVVKTARAHAADLTTETEAAAVALLCAEKRLAEFESGPVVAFAELRETDVKADVDAKAEGDVRADGHDMANGDMEEEGKASEEDKASEEGEAEAPGQRKLLGQATEDGDLQESVASVVRMEVEVAQDGDVAVKVASTVESVGDGMPADENKTVFEATPAAADGVAAVA